MLRLLFAEIRSRNQQHRPRPVARALNTDQRACHILHGNRALHRRVFRIQFILFHQRRESVVRVLRQIVIIGRAAERNGFGRALFLEMLPVYIQNIIRFSAFRLKFGKSADMAEHGGDCPVFLISADHVPALVLLLMDALNIHEEPRQRIAGLRL